MKTFSLLGKCCGIELGVSLLLPSTFPQKLPILSSFCGFPGLAADLQRVTVQQPSLHGIGRAYGLLERNRELLSADLLRLEKPEHRRSIRGPNSTGKEDSHVSTLRTSTGCSPGYRRHSASRSFCSFPLTETAFCCFWFQVERSGFGLASFFSGVLDLPIVRCLALKLTLLPNC